jgi:CBS domain-containing protein
VFTNFKKERSMKVKDAMTKEVRTCGLDSPLSEVARIMWRRDCGVIPVLDKGEVIGVITDRDICIAAGCKNVPLAGITVGEVMTRKLYSCLPDTDIREALETMREKQVRRLPVVDANGKLCGILSLDDVAIKARKVANPAELSSEDIENTLEAICRQRNGTREELRPQAAA